MQMLKTHAFIISKKNTKDQQGRMFPSEADNLDMPSAILSSQLEHELCDHGNQVFYLF